MNPNRGHELQDHRDAKSTTGHLFDATKWTVFYEQRNADIIVLHNETWFTSAIEIESSPRNVLRNLERNFTNGCDAVAVVSLTERYLGQITSKILDSDVYEKHQSRIRIFLYRTEYLNSLRDWIVELIASGTDQTGGTE